MKTSVLPRSDLVARILESGVIAVLRAQKPEGVLPACQALIEGGVRVLEITMTTPGALDQIRLARQEFGSTATVGAGTVLNMAQCHASLAAGAEFVVTPITRLGLIPAAHDADRPILVGAFSPTEAQVAYEAGADFVKIFPADVLPPSYFKSLRAPMPHLRMIPTGGITPENAGLYLRAGCVAVGIGSSLISPEILDQKRWSELTERARELTEVVKRFRG